MKTDFCRPRVIHSLFLSFNFCLEIFFRGAYIGCNWTFPLTDFIKFFQSTDCYPRIKYSWSKLDQLLSKIFNFVDDAVQKMQGAIRNWGRWSDIVVVMLPNILFVVIKLEQIVSIRVLELFIFGCTIWDRRIWEERESRNSLAGECWSYFNKSTLKSPKRKIVLFSFDNNRLY